MDKSGKVYVKAMNKYNDGYIDKSLALCEKSISLNITNAAALNLKGILYYLKGDLDNSKKTWDINYKRNNDKISKKYLKDILRDKEKLQLYVNALELIKQFNILSALEVLKQCENSHFNYINVKNLISLCYIKQGEYDKALPYIEDVLKTDKNNTAAIMNRKTLIEYGSLKPKVNYKKIFIVTASLFLIISVLFTTKIFISKLKNDPINRIKNVKKTTPLIKNNTPLDKESLNAYKAKPIENTLIEKPQFPQKQFKESISSNNMEQIIGYLNQWKNADLEMNDKLLIVKAEGIIKLNGIQYFYEKGIKYMEDKEYLEAEKYFLYALPYSSDYYLKEHIIYMLALSYKLSSDFENAIVYYELCLKQYPKGSYTQEVLYNLILIYKDVDINKAKGYAKNLIERFPESQYNNTIVKNILN